MLEVSFSPAFMRKYKLLDKELSEEVYEKIKLFKNKRNHQQLKVHKLKGKLFNRFSFTVSYKIRIIFQYLSKNEVVFLAIGSHDVYK